MFNLSPLSFLSNERWFMKSNPHIQVTLDERRDSLKNANCFVGGCELAYKRMIFVGAGSNSGKRNSCEHTEKKSRIHYFTFI